MIFNVNFLPNIILLLSLPKKIRILFPFGLCASFAFPHFSILIIFPLQKEKKKWFVFSSFPF